jgi:hypothetical protein
MRGQGYGWDDDEISHEIAKWVNGGMPLLIATAFVNGVGRGGLTEAEAIESIRNQSHSSMADSCISCRVIEDTDLPAEQAERGIRPTFRDAWEDDGAAIKVNMAKARGIHMDAIRAVRNAELTAQDIAFMRAVEAGDASAQATIGMEKQVLRDIPQTFDLTTQSPTELKRKWPKELPPRKG